MNACIYICINSTRIHIDEGAHQYQTALRGGSRAKHGVEDVADQIRECVYVGIATATSIQKYMLMCVCVCVCT
jgi:hypothetical protein